MRRHFFSYRSPYLWTLVGALGALGIVYGSCLLGRFCHYVKMSPTEKVIQHKLAKEGLAYDSLTFELVDPNAAPEGIREAVIKGYKIFIDTQKEAPEYVGARINCTNCHFSGGITTGGKGGGISLAGVAAKYPLLEKRSGTVIDLAQRINMCFRRSLNGKALPHESEEMIALLTYFHWISRDFPLLEKAPWLSMKYIDSKYTPDPKRGERLYNIECALCHQEHGEGEGVIPPLWGPTAFNDGAGMNKPKVFATFILYNMPYQSPFLTEEEAMDIAAYVTNQPRPEYKPD